MRPLSERDRRTFHSRQAVERRGAGVVSIALGGLAYLLGVSPTVAERIQSLPDAVAAPLREAVAIFERASLDVASEAREACKASGAQVAAALAAAGFPPAPTTWYGVRPMLASELTEAQRRVVEVYADVDELLRAEFRLFPEPGVGGWPIPPTASLIRRWLGLSGASALEEEHTLNGQRWPLWRHGCEPKGAETITALVDALPLDRALGVIDAVSHYNGYGFPRVQNLYRSARCMRELKGEGVAWARAFIERALAAIAAPSGKGGAAHAFEHDAALLALFAMVRGGVAIEPAWDVLLVCSYEHAPASFVEVAMAIPEERRHAVAARAVRGWGQTDTKVDKACALLEVFDSTAVARATLELSPRTINPKRTVQRIADLSTTRPGVARALSEHRRKLPQPVPLMLRERVHPVSEQALSPAHAAQLAAVKQGDPDSFEAAELVDDLELRLLTDEAGKPAFDAWLYATDSGAYFVAGTTELVAHRVQGGMEALGGTSAALLAGLDETSARRGAPARAATRADGRASRPAKKTAKKTTPKKAAGAESAGPKKGAENNTSTKTRKAAKEGERD